ncbi:hypothetical protein CDD83_424 [Cordyceps sp. RAO-2017]|nr:hypothetical protein CDD83_424 [Cordyceps sp. RAO-2017]
MPLGNPFFECGTCGKEFPSGWQARENHCYSTGHAQPDHECDTCHRWFRSRAACAQHMNDTGHWVKPCRPYACSLCDDTWSSKGDLTQHEHYSHNYCADCRRVFQNLNNLKMHLNSHVHRGSTISCPFCSKSYTTATGLSHHLESGSCPKAPFLDRDSIYRFIRSKDPHGSISKNLLEWNGSCQYEANDRSFNGDAFECYLCHREFRSLGGLNQHLNSPTHQQALYHCPNRACRKDFKSLAGIINHLESESCGITRFDKIQAQVGDFIRGGRMLTL